MENLQTMKITSRQIKTYAFFLATFMVAFLVSLSMVKPTAPNAGVVEADINQVKSAQIAKSPNSYDFPELKNIPKSLIPEPEIYTGSFLYQSAEDLIKSQGLQIDSKAIVVESGLPSKLGIGYYEVKVFIPQKVFYNYGGSNQGVITTWAGTVSEILDQLKKEKGIEVGKDDVVKPARDTKLIRSDLFVLEITPVQDTEISEIEEISFRTVVTRDNQLELGREVLDQRGRDGIKTLKYAIHREMLNDRWVETDRKLISTEVTREPVEQREIHGTKIITYGTGQASFYDSAVAAHRTLPFGTKVRVVNLANGKSVIVTIGDRGPFVPGRIIDLSRSAFSQIAPLGQGVITVEVQKIYLE